MTTQIDYKKQAQDFLGETKTTFSIVKIGRGTFDGDRKGWIRNKYAATFSRGDHTEWFEFTNSAHINKDGSLAGEYDRDRSARTEKDPSAYDVLACLQKYDVGTFKNFCDDFGYDEDSKKAEKTYFAVQEEFKKVKALWGDSLEKLQEIQ